jgi:hypothetical protein
MPKSVSPEESSFGSDPTESVTDVADATSVSDLARSVEVEIRGKAVSVAYDLSEMTPRLRKKLTALESSDNAEDAIVEYLSTIVTAWNLTDRRGNAVDLADLDAVSYRDLGEIAEAINKDLLPNA